MVRQRVERLDQRILRLSYEMLRAHAGEGRSVVSLADEFGFSRETYYSALAAFEAGGVAWLADGKPGRPGPLKLTDEAAQWVLDLHRRRRNLSGRELAEKLAEELGIKVHRRTIERLLGGGIKKTNESGSCPIRSAIEPIPFLEAGGTAQSRYERLRRYVLEEPARRPRTSPAQFDLQRFKRFGLLGLVAGHPRSSPSGDFEIQLVPLGAEDAEQRLDRLCGVLAGLVMTSEGGWRCDVPQSTPGSRRTCRRKSRRSKASSPPSSSRLSKSIHVFEDPASEYGRYFNLGRPHPADQVVQG
jgi:transposase